MKRIITIVVAVILTLVWVSIPAFATSTPKQEQDQKQYQGQEQDQSQGQEQGQDQYQDQSMGDMIGGTQTMSFKGVEQAFSANAPNVFATAPCYVGGSAAIGLKGLNIGGGKMKLDEQCELRETARMLIAAGEVELGVMMLCLTDAAQLLPACHPHTDVKASLKAAQDRVAFLLNERQIDRATCEESKDRIAEAFNTSCGK